MHTSLRLALITSSHAVASALSSYSQLAPAFVLPHHGMATCWHCWGCSASRPPHVLDAAGDLSLICSSDVCSQREIEMFKGTPARRSVAVASCWVSATRPSPPLIQHMGPYLFMEKKLEDV